MFSQSERLIYKYNAEGKVKVADPLRLLNKLTAEVTQEAVQRDFKLLSIDKPESQEAVLRLATLARTVFNLKELSLSDEGEVQGVTDAEALVLLVDFSQWCEETQARFFTMLPSLNSTEKASSDTEVILSPISV